MKKILLIFPRPISEMPTGFAYINAVLKQKGYECKALVNTFKQYYSDEEILEEVKQYNPDIVGFNIGTLRLLDTYSLVKKIKELGVIVIAGGPHATTRPDEVLNHDVDIVIRNEGEVTLAELCDKDFSNLASILGISYKKDGIIWHNSQRPYADLATIPRPDFSCFDIDKFLTSEGVPKGLHRVYCSRGCPGVCLTGETIIHTLDGDIKIRDLVGKTVKVLTRDPSTQEPIYANAINIRKTRENAELVRVHFTDNTFIDCTPEHKFKVFKSKNQYIKEREWDVEAKDLVPKQQVRAVAFISSRKRVYLSTRRTISIARDRLVMKTILGRPLLDTEWVHHKDRNLNNDKFSNLELTTQYDHIPKCHPEVSERMKRNNPIFLLTKEERIARGKMVKGVKRTLEQRLKYRETKLGPKNPRYNPSLVKHQNHKSRIPEVNHKIAFVEKLPYREDVYCLEVPNIEWFYANKVLVHNCTFCDSSIFGHKERYRPLEIVLDEIEYRHKTFGIESFVIADDTFTASKKYVREFCAGLKALNLPIVWSCSTRANLLTDELLTIMKDAGCYLVAFGIESGDPETLKRIRKGVSLEQCHKAIDLVSSHGMRIFVNLMVGFPRDTNEAVLNTIDYINKHFNQVFVYQVSGSLCPYPNTPMYEDYKDEYHITDWWLWPEYQNFGQQIHQNTAEPYKVSTFYQRNLYDDTYIWEEKFFSFSKSYKKLVKKMAFIIGKRNLLSENPSAFKRFLIYNTCKVSRFFYELFPNLEKAIVSKLVDIFKFKSMFHDRMPLGAEAKIINIKEIR
jgi:radical SAM superfamily enzyme YgiQ (UPF0313 family)